MTEAEWLTDTDIMRLLGVVQRLIVVEKRSYRKLRLFACASCRQVWDSLSNDLKEGLESAEKHEDGMDIGGRMLMLHDSADQFAFTELAEEVNFAPFLRDIYGNPFRTVSFSPTWRTDTAVSLARMMYEARDFSAMPILADALQDAGCDNPDILSHCRDTSLTHVRGCWVTDLVLSKS